MNKLSPLPSKNQEEPSGSLSPTKRISLKRRLWLAFYNYFVKYMPYNASIIKLGQGRLRELCVKKVCRSVGSNLYIDKGVDISFDLSIGNNSGIGSFGHACGDVTIGDNVLIAPDLILYHKP